MSIPKHIIPPGPAQTFFLTTSAYQKHFLFQSERMATLLIATLYAYRAQQKFRLHAFVVMPNHIHLVITPAPNITLERTMQLIKGGFSFRVKKELQLSSEIWQKGYTDRRVRSLAEFATFRDYIHLNPVKAGLVGAAADWPYSSAGKGFELDPHIFPSAAKAGS